MKGVRLVQKEGKRGKIHVREREGVRERMRGSEGVSERVKVRE